MIYIILNSYWLADICLNPIPLTRLIFIEVETQLELFLLKLEQL